MKHKFVTLIVLLLSLFLAVNSLAAAPGRAAAPGGDAPLTKQIAVPPAEMQQQALPDPAANGARSRAALIPIQLHQLDEETWQWTETVAVDGREQISLMLLAPAGAGWQLAVQTPGSNLLPLDGQTAGVTHRAASLGMGATQYPGEVYTFTDPPAGLWTMQVSAGSGPAQAGVAGYLLMATDSPYRLYTHLTTYDLLVGRQVGLATRLYDADAATDTAGDMVPLAGAIESATMRLQTPDGQELSLPLWDDGQHQDKAANDGIFGVTLTPEVAGTYIAQVTVAGVAPDGRAFIRTSEHIFPILAQTLALADKPVRSRNLDGVRLQLDVQANALVGGDIEPVLAFAEVWGTDSAGSSVPVAWIGGIVTPQPGGARLSLPLTLDTRWIELAGAQAPFVLRNVRVQDVDTAVRLAHHDALPINLDYTAGKQVVTQITDDMLMGAAPAASAGPESAGVLMLIHGYCSSSVWPTADFTQYAVFADHNQNRSHDQFAQLIDAYGDNFSSFGAVAHSQGGAASLHLYTYYWSGLDYSSGNRLIQSVGTPYRGTALAGMLAVLGEIFGVGCGTNWDLTYDGASLWLSGIPGWARSRVYYYTTAFKDVWWRYDYCHIASDLFLDDPDDGTTERWAGQLSGANNMGHKSGWCHTNGMRDPAQYNDHTRNANMNANGNR